MTNKEILEKAIQRVIDNGWDPIDEMASWIPKGDSIHNFSVGPRIGVDMLEVSFTTKSRINFSLDVFTVIFSSSFAKALWGDANPEGYMLHINGKTLATEFIDGSWHYHSQQMVIADDPIKYLGENI